MTVPFLQVSGLNKNFGGLQALRDCSFAIEKGRITCLVGPNGAGKTTVFNAITGFLRPESGSVQFQGRSLDRLPPRAIVRSGIARSFQNLRLYADMTVLENVTSALPGQFGEQPLSAIFRPFRTARAMRQANEQAAGILEHVGLGDQARVWTRNLSYGEQKLLCIARLLATGADLLLLDEPTSGLSGEALDRVMALLRRLQAEGKSQLVVEHNTRVVMAIADEVVFLHGGHVLAQGSPAEITADPALAEIYFGGAL
ncbi:ABC transporter ATP-binding protein [Acidisphaera sp. L21]|uniref:ABC transporter ATP-binding protein n=1 Tax=Acidisphaera sp. L21 TaxID=1641851 RepID=UPI00131DE577|nr:ABC transporter ATP-binding protein [Acidisphaera sp. L21]